MQKITVKAIFAQQRIEPSRKPRLVFCFQNCFDLLREKIVLVMEKKLLKFEADDREFLNTLRSLEQFIQTVKDFSLNRMHF